MQQRIDTKGFTLVYIYTAGRSGSTLLGLLLNGHSQILDLGEISTLNTLFNPFKLPDHLSAAFSENYLAFWNGVKRRYEEALEESFEQIDLGHPRFRRILFCWKDKDVQKWVRPRAFLFSCIHQICKVPILVDGSKCFQQLYLLCCSGLFNLKVIHLVRDGRAVTNSYIRRYNTFWGGVKTYVLTNMLSIWLRRKVGKDNY